MSIFSKFNNNRGIRFLLMIPVFLIAAVSAVLIRTYLALNYMDAVSGMYTQDPLIEFVLYGILIVSFLLLFLLPAGRKKETEAPLTPVSPIILRISNILIGVLIAVFFVFNLKDFITNYDSKAITVFTIAEIITMLLAALAFFEKGVKINLLGDFTAALYVFPCIWSACRLTNTFSKYTAVANVPEHLFAILSLIGITMFLLAEGQYMAETVPGEKHGKMWRWSFICSTVVFAHTLPKLIIQLSSNDQGIKDVMGYPGVVDIALAVYALLFVFSIYSSSVWGESEEAKIAAVIGEETEEFHETSAGLYDDNETSVYSINENEDETPANLNVDNEDNE